MGALLQSALRANKPISLFIIKNKLKHKKIPFEHRAMGEGHALLLEPCSENKYKC